MERSSILFPFLVGKIIKIFRLPKTLGGGGIMVYRVEGVGEWKRKNKESS